MARDLVCQAGGGDRQTSQYCPSLVPQVGRTKAQNWEAISQYYTMETWHALSDLRVLEASKLDLVLDVPRALGLRFPSETTFQVLATMHCLATHGPDRTKSLSMDAKLAFFRHVKATFKRKVANLAAPLHFIDILPGASA